jgi:hypothetical protein
MAPGGRIQLLVDIRDVLVGGDMSDQPTLRIIVVICEEDNPVDVDEVYGAGTYARLFPDKENAPGGDLTHRGGEDD